MSLLFSALLGACGATKDAGNSDGNRGGSSATAGSGGANAAGRATSAGGTQQNSPCLEPVAASDASRCDFDAYAFDVQAERCRYFIKASCEVTKNRFDSLEACVAACDEGGLERCQISADCAVQSAGCCGGCEPLKEEDLRAVNIAYAETQTCPDVSCGACPDYDGPPELPYYGATCTDQRCELFDVRETELGSCETDEDCRLRRGLECCECGSAGAWVAVSNQPLVAANLLCGAPVNCDQTCERTPPANLRASCVANRCLVSTLEP